MAGCNTVKEMKILDFPLNANSYGLCHSFFVFVFREILFPQRQETTGQRVALQLAHQA